MKRDGFRETVQEVGPIVAMTVAWIAMLGSLYYSEIAGFVPCKLCWYQRILMYPLALVILIGVIRHDDYLPGYVLPFSLLGMGVSTYHYLIQQGLFGQSDACTIGIPCTLRYVDYAGFVTIPLMALTAFVLITVLMLVTRWAHQHPDDEVPESVEDDVGTTDEQPAHPDLPSTKR